ncbi:hypothetical protein FLACOL7796_03018 [Flavobacterium collinsii]|uniref:Immunity protein 63 domain-containing protein n=1 Tax=Flavobacterium collinsii TaxID=1114861 RepID=A0ABM8KKN2_9FLAO|nr:hypothetical protein FLACOL7796_03018 [Flavobacterium collinsii]
MPDIDLKNSKQELYNGYSRHNETKSIIIDFINNKISSFIFRYNRTDKNSLVSYSTFDFNFCYIENEIETELFYINCDHSRKTLLSFLEILQYIENNYDVSLTNEFYNDGYFYDKKNEEIVRYLYR